MTDAAASPGAVDRVEPEQLYASPNALAPDYSRFRVAERLLLTGHSHQAWPDRGFAGQAAAWEDAAELVDEKWERAFTRAERVREGWRRLLDDPGGEIALGGSTHDLVVRLLSALPLRQRPRLLTTDGEFHTLRRQLDRLAEEGIDVSRVPAAPATTLAARLASEVDDRTALVAVSSVLFRDAAIVPGLGELMAACRRVGAELLVDAYHQLGVVPCSLRRQGLDSAFIVGGGYKYCQLGEGNCFLRVPPECTLRPVVTGWFAEFSALAETPGERVLYGDGADRFAGATYDPTSHYRASEVFDFFRDRGLDAGLLRTVSQHQVGLLMRGFDELDLDPGVVARDRDTPPEAVGGFLALHCPRAPEIDAGLRRRGVHADHRGEVLRLGPAPYLSDARLHDALAALGEAVREVTS